MSIASFCRPQTQMHADQAIQCLHAGKHVLVEIPMADNLADSRRLVAVQNETGLVAMAGHVRRFNPSHQWIHNKIKAGELSLAAAGCTDLLLPPDKYECLR